MILNFQLLFGKGAGHFLALIFKLGGHLWVRTVRIAEIKPTNRATISKLTIPFTCVSLTNHLALCKKIPIPLPCRVFVWTTLPFLWKFQFCGSYIFCICPFFCLLRPLLLVIVIYLPCVRYILDYIFWNIAFHDLGGYEHIDKWAL